eukprot:1083224-Rhodomonas_salina.1
MPSTLPMLSAMLPFMLTYMPGNADVCTVIRLRDMAAAAVALDEEHREAKEEEASKEGEAEVNQVGCGGLWCVRCEGCGRRDGDDDDTDMDIGRGPRHRHARGTRDSHGATVCTEMGRRVVLGSGEERLVLRWDSVRYCDGAVCGTERGEAGTERGEAGTEMGHGAVLAGTERGEVW